MSQREREIICEEEEIEDRFRLKKLMEKKIKKQIHKVIKYKIRTYNVE